MEKEFDWEKFAKEQQLEIAHYIRELANYQNLKNQVSVLIGIVNVLVNREERQ